MYCDVLNYFMLAVPINVTIAYGITPVQPNHIQLLLFLKFMQFNMMNSGFVISLV